MVVGMERVWTHTQGRVPYLGRHGLALWPTPIILTYDAVGTSAAPAGGSAATTSVWPRGPSPRSGLDPGTGRGATGAGATTRATPRRKRE